MSEELQFNVWEPKICVECGSDQVECIGCRYVCMFCGNMEGCSD